MNDLTIVLLVKNEEKNLPRSLSSIKDLGEILVIDDDSSDNSLKIAKEFKAQVENRKLDDYASQRNFALSKVKTEWVLFLDADEEVSSELKEEIIKILKNTKLSGFKIPRKNIIFDKVIEHTGWSPDLQLHLFRTKKGKYQRKVHEFVEVDGEIGELKESIIHYNYQTVSQYLEKLFKYTTLEAENLHAKGYIFEWKDLIRKPFNEFLRRFFAEKGFLDGTHGLALSILQAFYEFVVILKIWEMKKFPKEEISPDVFNTLNKSSEELKYWLLEEEKSPLKKLFQRYIK